MRDPHSQRKRQAHEKAGWRKQKDGNHDSDKKTRLEESVENPSRQEQRSKENCYQQDEASGQANCGFGCKAARIVASHAGEDQQAKENQRKRIYGLAEQQCKTLH